MTKSSGAPAEQRKSVATGLRWRYSLATLVLIGLAGASLMVAEAVVDQAAAYAALINTSGRQRMLAQRAVLYLRATFDAPDAQTTAKMRSEAVEAYSEFERASEILQKVRNSNAPLPFAVLKLPPKARELFDGPAGVDALSRQYIKAMGELLAGGQTHHFDAVLAVRALAQDRLVPALDPFVFNLQESSTLTIRRLELYNLLLYAALLGAVLMQVFLVFSPLIKSLSRSLRETQVAFNDYRNVQEQLEERERRASTIASCTTEGILVIEDGKIVHCNEAFMQIYGYTLEELLALNPMNLVTPERREHSRRRLTFGIEGQDETIGLRKSGAAFPMHSSVRQYTLGDSTVRIACLRDISEQKKLEAVQETARLAAESTARFRSEFVANISHEIRTPLNGIIGMTDLILETSLNEEQRRYADIVRTSGEHLLSLINDVLDLSKIESGKIDLEVSPIDVRNLVESQAELFLGKARQKGLQIQTYVNPAIPTGIMGDGGRINQILLNFLNNAIKFTQVGHVLVRADLESEDDTKCYLRFSVQDTGMGMPSDVVLRLFTPFTQGDGSTARRFGGTGLGLSICRQLATLMHGSVGVETRPNEGSTFWFKVGLPRNSAPSDQGDRLSVQLTGLRALLVDHDPVSQEILKHYLKAWQMDVISCVDCDSALLALQEEVIAKRTVDLVIIDSTLTGLNSMETSAALRKISGYETTPHVLITARELSQTAAEMHQAGFSGYLSKPIRQSVLYDTLVNTRLCCLPISALPMAEPAATRRKRILVAEDNSVNQLLVLTHLKSLGYVAQAVGNGREVLKTLALSHWDLVLMDCQMPDMDGFEAAQAIRRNEAKATGPRIPVIALTANAMAEDRDRCLRAGMDDYVSKPIKRAILAKTLERWLGPLEDASLS